MENIQKNSLLGQMHLKESRLIHERCYTMRHASGLPIYVVPKKMSTSYAVLGTRYGSIDNCFRLAGEDTFTRVPDGIAHFLEHKMFENENGEDTFARFARTGANANAYTSFDLTAYLFSCTENFVPSLEILLDFVTQPYFTPETVLKEQGIIGQELRMYEDDPGQTVFYNMLKAMYASHPFVSTSAVRSNPFPASRRISCTAVTGLSTICRIWDCLSAAMSRRRKCWKRLTVSCRAKLRRRWKSSAGIQRKQRQ